MQTSNPMNHYITTVFYIISATLKLYMFAYITCLMGMYNYWYALCIIMQQASGVLRQCA